MLFLLKKLFESIEKKKQISAIFLILSMTLSSLTELASVALIAPFISLVLGNKEVQNGRIYLFMNKYFNNNDLILLVITVFRII